MASKEYVFSIETEISSIAHRVSASARAAEGSRASAPYDASDRGLHRRIAGVIQRTNTLDSVSSEYPT
jgi:hypothetical protein